MSNKVPVEEMDDLMEGFPLTSIENLENMENKIDTQLKLKLITYLSRVGGYTVNEMTKLLLRKLITDQVAAQFSWLEAKKKKIFGSLQLADIILKAVKRSLPMSKEKKIIDSIKNWLRHASTRTYNKEKKEGANPDDL